MNSREHTDLQSAVPGEGGVNTGEVSPPVNQSNPSVKITQNAPVRLTETEVIREYGIDLVGQGSQEGATSLGCRLVYLTDCHQSVSLEVAGRRDQQNRDEGKLDLKVSKGMTGAEISYLGMAGELAFCLMENLMPDIGWKEKMLWDCLWKGLRVDVKTTRRLWEPHLNVVPWKKDKSDRPDVYVLMVDLCNGWYRYMGFLGSEEIFGGRYTVDGQISVPWECLKREDIQ